MKQTYLEAEWPNGKSSKIISGGDWFQAAKEAGIEIPTGCLSGSCGACEIEVNGEIIRACINHIPEEKSGHIKIKFAVAPFWQEMI